MSGAAEQFEGGCLCGAIRFIATGRPIGVYWCHCESCRKHTGAPASVFVAFKREAYTVTKGEITKFDSTPGQTRRGFCARCGSTLTCETLPQLTETHFHVGAFDQAALLQPTKHYFSEERLPWLHTGDG
ncbi:MAG: GFA family protein [Candidatus Binataceae bacterium]